ncbi:MAG: hypothetical protein WCO06_05050 [Candidatus Roizmanbacteria bacterium]
MNTSAPKISTPIDLSIYSNALVDTIKAIKPKNKPDDYSKLSVSQTASFLALVYEKIRNAIEYHEEHLIRRAAIERIVRRRLAINPSGKGEAENILRELLWARYFPNESVGEEDVQKSQQILEKYLLLKRLILSGRNSEQQAYFTQFIIDLLSCEIEESLSIESSTRESAFTYFVFQTLRKKIKIEGITDDLKDAYFFIAVDKSYRKSADSHQRYHMFSMFYKSISEYKPQEIQDLATRFPEITKKIDALLKNDYVENLAKFLRRQLPPYLILFDIFLKKPQGWQEKLKSKESLWLLVDQICKDKYQFIKGRLRLLTIRSLIYIIITKMAFLILVEIPLSQMIYGAIHFETTLILLSAPVIIMMLIILTTHIPGEDNTKFIYQRIIDIIDKDSTFEERIAYISRKRDKKRPFLIFIFTLLYIATFVLTLFVMYFILSLINFTAIQMGLFLFFVSVISFFAYRIRQVANEYRLNEKDNILSPLVDVFFMPILALGKFFSNEVSARLNIFIIIFDFFIEAPFKLIVEVIEEWIRFVKARKDEIV